MTVTNPSAAVPDPAHAASTSEPASPAFPVTFDDPADAELTWDRDDMHMPFALTPLAAEYIRTLGAGFNGRYEELGGGFPQRWKVAIWNGYAYFTVHLKATDEERAEIYRRWGEMSRERVPTAAAWWREEALAELATLYRRIGDVDVEALPGSALAQAWTNAWADAQRAWEIHFIAIIAPYQVLEDLADAYAKAVPEAGAGEAVQLTQGFDDDLFKVELDSERLAARAARIPGVVARLRDPRPVGREELLDVDGGPAFVADLDAFLAEHGHLGQGFDDLTEPSWIEDPSRFLAELAKRIAHPAVSAARRRDRLRAEADALAEKARARLAGNREDLEAFDRLLALARAVGPITEGHNYWIDRMVQSRIRVLATRVGRRLVAEGSIDAVDDVFFLRHPDITDALVQPRDLRPLVRERKAEHEQNKTLRPPAVVGTPRATEDQPDRFDGVRIVSDDPDELRGTGASSGVVRGPARVALSPDDFGRIVAGDIIVCPSSNPSWVPVFAIAGGLVTNTGGVLSHAAVVAREFGLPAVVGTADATTRIADGRLIEIDGTRGTVRLL